MFTITSYAAPAWPNDTWVEAEAGALIDMDSGTIIFAQNSHEEYPPASITKLLTALLVVENTDLDDIVTFSETAMNSVEADSGNRLGLVAGDTMTVEDALYAMLLISVNQAANALAEHVAGSISAFVDMMNERVESLGLTESHFDNPSGLNGNTQYVSAHDMAIIASEAYSNETVLEISSTISYTLGPIENHPEGYTVENEHRLVYTTNPESDYYCPEAKAGKTGYLRAAGNTLVTYGERDGRRLISVILKGTSGQYFIDGKTLLQFGFDNFYNLDIASSETRYVTGESPVEIGGETYDPTDLMIEPGHAITLPNSASFEDADLIVNTDIPEKHPGGTVALLEYEYNGRAIGSAFLVKKYEYVPTGETDEASSDASDFTEETVYGPYEDETWQAPVNYEDETAAEEINEERSGSVTLKGVLKVLAVAAIILLIVYVLLFYISYRRRKARREAAIRRARRLRRMREGGADMEAEYHRLMMEKRRNSRSGSTGRRTGSRTRSSGTHSSSGSRRNSGTHSTSGSGKSSGHSSRTDNRRRR